MVLLIDHYSVFVKCLYFTGIDAELGVSWLQATENPNLWVSKTLLFSMMHFMVLRNYNLRMLFPLIADVGVCGVHIQILGVMFH